MNEKQDKGCSNNADESDNKITTKCYDVEGIKNQYNCVYVRYGTTVKQYVIFFPGDVQDFYEDMESHRDNHRWKDYCYENCSEILLNKFPESYIIIIKPSKLNFKTFACYENFFPNYNFGVPSYQQDVVHSWLHLSRLLERLSGKEHEEFGIVKEMTSLPIRLVSFSKGCEVLNQLVMELPLLKVSSGILESTCLPRVYGMCWLDNGLPGNSGAWVTHEECLRHAWSSFRSLESHTTLYQLKDTTRPWIGREKKKFTQLLSKFISNDTATTTSARYDDKSYFVNEPQTLDTHFSILKVFSPTEV